VGGVGVGEPICTNNGGDKGERNLAALSKLRAFISKDDILSSCSPSIDCLCERAVPNFESPSVLLTFSAKWGCNDLSYPGPTLSLIGLIKTMPHEPHHSTIGQCTNATRKYRIIEISWPSYLYDTCNFTSMANANTISSLLSDWSVSSPTSILEAWLGVRLQQTGNSYLVTTDWSARLPGYYRTQLLGSNHGQSSSGNWEKVWEVLNN